VPRVPVFGTRVSGSLLQTSSIITRRPTIAAARCRLDSVMPLWLSKSQIKDLTAKVEDAAA
jgi:hypothetical protein